MKPEFLISRLEGLYITPEMAEKLYDCKYLISYLFFKMPIEFKNKKLMNLFQFYLGKKKILSLINFIVAKIVGIAVFKLCLRIINI
jgi:hypothetical protein